MKNPGVIWLPLGEHIREMLPWLPAEPPEHQESIYLPFMQHEREEGQGIRCEVSERSLLLAIMMQYPCDAPGIAPGIVQPYMRLLFPMLADGFQIGGLENLFLQVGATIRSEYGQIFSRIALRTGMLLVPDSSAIRSDFMLDTWCRLQNGDPENWHELASDAVEAFAGVVKETDSSTAWQVCIQIFIVSLAILGRWPDAEAAYAKYTTELRDPDNHDQIGWMLENRAIEMNRLKKPTLRCQ